MQQKQELKTYGIIMAGGSGTRFWPLSRAARPKQFLAVAGEGGETLLEQTVRRAQLLIPLERIYIVVHESFLNLVREVLPDFPTENILPEPEARNTTACIGYAAVEIGKKEQDAMLCIFPADHVIRGEKAFTENVNHALELAADGALVTIGIKPEYPATGFGYMQCREEKVQRFREKPSREVATEYLKQGDYYWNSGMFFWKLSAIMLEIQTCLPRVYEALQELKTAQAAELSEIYHRLPSISIDVGVLEQAEQVKMVRAEFDWDDVGSFSSLEKYLTRDENGNALQMKEGAFLGIDTKNCMICGEKRLIAGIGLEDLFIIDTRDALLVCSKERAQDVKKVAEALRQTEMVQYL